MNLPAGFIRPDLETLFALFPPADDVPEYELVSADEVPSPYLDLLVHEHHMTVTVERYHGDLVNVVILDRHIDDESYARKILLTLRGSAKVVQFGIMRVNMHCCSPEVQAEIRAGQTPLGRILIQHDVLRRIEPTAFVRVTTGPAMMQWFGLDRPQTTYGRLAVIHCNGYPAIDLLEIVRPE